MKPLHCSHGHENPPNSRFCLHCGEKLEQAENGNRESGLALAGRYRIVRELGHGGFGRTYLAQDLNRFGEACVLKEFAPQVQGTFALQKASELFEREAGVLYKLKHPQIPEFRELLRVKKQGEGRLFLIQDYIAGQTCRAILEARRNQGLRFNETEILKLLRQILPVLDYIHSLGVIHRDISPENIIIRQQDGLPVLIDFGGVKQVAATVASQVMASSPATATRLGKVGYAPHEQMQGGIVSASSDLYALGATVLVLLTGKEPSEFIDPHTLTWDRSRHFSATPLSPTLSHVLEQLLQPHPRNRPQSAKQVLQMLNPQSPPAAYSPPPPPSPQTQATVAVSPGQVAPTPPSPPAPVAQRSAPSAAPSGNNNAALGWLGKLLLVLGLILAAGAFGWWAGNLWIDSQLQSNQPDATPTVEDFENPVISPEDDDEPEPSSDFSPEEQRRKQALRQRRMNLGIDYDFYVSLVDEAFWNEYPRQRGVPLSTDPDDARLREAWDKIAANVLTQIEQLDLSRQAKSELGSYDGSDRDRWKRQVNRLRVSSRALYDLADARFFRIFPKQEGETGSEFLDQPIGQIWQATVADTVKALQSREALDRIIFESGDTGTQMSGTLQPGEGKAFTAELAADQLMEVNLSTAPNALLSIYSPTGNTIFLEDSRQHSFSGELPESGFYEFVVVSDADEPIDYQLDLTVENPPESDISVDKGIAE
ncbi:MAG: serine/threonine-protein kinase [Coleofasciculus sp. A1-SPW-01]|uniref:protein kinase domain-containing protein n=1 Tax=Coleofasciculus sp. A1-SPW-01 TaxID=3070819 RepID=UPI0032F51724